VEHASAPAWASALEASALGALMRDSYWMYPAANLLHILGLVMLVGGIGVLDLRLLGAGRAIPVAAAARLLTPIALVGLLFMALSGTALFSADARAVVTNPVFQIKMALLAFGVANALLFRLLWNRRLPTCEAHPPAFGRLQTALSLAGWVAVAACGRLIAYF
jgi:hypothetical protein